MHYFKVQALVCGMRHNLWSSDATATRIWALASWDDANANIKSCPGQSMYYTPGTPE